MNKNAQELAQSMKTLENAATYHLASDSPVIIRVNGNIFNRVLNSYEQPFDKMYRKAMKNTMLALCDHIQNCCLGYTFFDEISLLLIQQKGSNAWFNNDVAKIISYTASLATMIFHREFSQCINQAKSKRLYEEKDWMPLFHANAFTIPKESIDDYFLYRQNKCIRKSIVAASTASTGIDSKILGSKKTSDLLQILKDTGFPWESYPVQSRYGTFAIQKKTVLLRYADKHMNPFMQIKWGIYPNTPQLYFVKHPFIMNHLINTNV